PMNGCFDASQQQINQIRRFYSIPQTPDSVINPKFLDHVNLDLTMSYFIHHVNLVSFILDQLFVLHCAFSFSEKNSELYQLAVFSRKLHLLSESALAFLTFFVN
ncbi:MAG: hypothetical protein KZQ66_18320, partial [Candidatus Thiodiazotropha sp. (ex Lucinoma aequizonata)]|nr:hypothetical protein [Candidatus Thiodiazotropha sp. (ex Lucinoma aequizonata)]